MNIINALKTKSVIFGAPWYEILIWIAIVLFAMWFGANVL